MRTLNRIVKRILAARSEFWEARWCSGISKPYEKREHRRALRRLGKALAVDEFVEKQRNERV